MPKRAANPKTGKNRKRGAHQPDYEPRNYVVHDNGAYYARGRFQTTWDKAKAARLTLAQARQKARSWGGAVIPA